MRLSSVAWNLAGLGLPLGVALLAIPSLLQTLGSERFGLLSLVWAVTAISGLFDLGIGRATTRLVAEYLGSGEPGRIASTTRTALRISAGAGLTGGALLALAVALNAQQALNFSPDLDNEVRGLSWLLALTVPLQTLIATYRGISEGCQQFRGISIIRMGLGSANFAAPWLVSSHSSSLLALTASLVVARVLALVAFRALALQAMPKTADMRAASGRSEASRLMHAGGWLTLSAVLSPLLVQTDRFVIGSVISASAVTVYAVPFDIVTQLLIGVSAIATVAFPSITRQLHQDPLLAHAEFRRWLVRVAVVMAMVCGTSALLLPSALPWWIGHELDSASVTIGQWLCLGVWLNSVGAMYYSWLHAHGRFKTTALLHLLELPLYLLVLMAMLHQFGVIGAAIAWVLRVGLDTASLALASQTRRI